MPGSRLLEGRLPADAGPAQASLRALATTVLMPVTGVPLARHPCSQVAERCLPHGSGASCVFLQERGAHPDEMGSIALGRRPGSVCSGNANGAMRVRERDHDCSVRVVIGGLMRRDRAGQVLALAVAAACMIFQCAASSGAARAASPDPSAYGIRAKPKAGPVNEFQPIKSLPPVRFELPFDWGMDPHDDQTWRVRLQSLRLVDEALAAGDFGYAGEVFHDWQRWHENCWWSSPLCFERTSDQSWHDMATGIRASRLAYLLRSTGWQDGRLVQLAEQHAEKLQVPSFVADNHNHAVFQLHGLGR
jgi:hypothetical protein